MPQQCLLNAKAELDAAWVEAVSRSDAALVYVEEARASPSPSVKAEYLRITEAALFAHRRWCNAVTAAVAAMDEHFEETSLFPADSE
jgi:hypothetical protein